MTNEPREARTSVAILKRISPDHLEVRYLPSAVLTTDTLAEMQRARRELMGTIPYCLLTFIPEDVDYAVSAMSVDHLATDRSTGALIAVALVAQGHMMELMLNLYFSYFPKLDRIHVTPSEADARQWLEKQMEELGRNGE